MTYQPVTSLKWGKPDRGARTVHATARNRSGRGCPPPAIGYIPTPHTAKTYKTRFGALDAFVQANDPPGPPVVFLHGSPKNPGGTADRWWDEPRSVWLAEAWFRGYTCIALQAPLELNGTARTGWDPDMRPDLLRAIDAVTAEFGPLAGMCGFSDGASEAAYVGGVRRVPFVCVGAPGAEGFSDVLIPGAFRDLDIVIITDEDRTVPRVRGGEPMTLDEYAAELVRKFGVNPARLGTEVGGQGHTVPPRLARWVWDRLLSGSRRDLHPWERLTD